jgi:YD repeat-containing protein
MRGTGLLREKTDDESADTTSYAYDAAGNLRTVDLPDGRHLRYLIDGLGRRVGREGDGQLDQGLLYGDGSRPSAELTSTGTIRSRFVYVTRSTVPDYMIRAGHTYRLVIDHQGRPRLIIDVARNGMTGGPDVIRITGAGRYASSTP